MVLVFLEWVFGAAIFSTDTKYRLRTKGYKYSWFFFHIVTMGGNPNSSLHGAAYVIRLYSRVKDKPWILKAKQYVQSAIHEVGTVESFERISKLLALDTLYQYRTAVDDLFIW